MQEKFFVLKVRKETPKKSKRSASELEDEAEEEVHSEEETNM